MKNKRSLITGLLIVNLAIATVTGGCGNTEKVSTAQSRIESLVSTYSYSVASFATETIEASVKDSYILKEIEYANGSTERENFIKAVCSNVDLSLVGIEQVGTFYSVTLSANVVDWSNLTAVLSEDIREGVVNRGIYDSSYTYQDDLIDYFCEYYSNLYPLPTEVVNIILQVEYDSATDTYVFVDDSALDNALFASDRFHLLEDEFSKVAIAWTGYVTEEYIDTEMVANPEYEDWYKLFITYYESDNGRYNKYTSLWEPFYLRDENNEFVIDEDGNKVVDFYTIKDENGKDWVQPDSEIPAEVIKEREVEAEFTPEMMINYVWCGSYYVENLYTGNSPKEMQVGDGSETNPAGVGTRVITKVLGADGVMHDIRLTMTGYWLEQNAIDYAMLYSENNRGFDATSIVKLICVEFKVENLEDSAITISSEAYLGDGYGNTSARNGTMYGFYNEDITIEPHSSVVINDWSNSTEIYTKYLCWGSSFTRGELAPVYFRILAGDIDSSATVSGQ